MLELFDLERVTSSQVGANNANLAPNDPDRWAIGFLQSAAVAGSVDILPFSIEGNAPVIRLTAGELMWFTLFNHGPMVPRQWYVSGTPNVVVSVFTVTYRG